MATYSSEIKICAVCGWPTLVFSNISSYSLLDADLDRRFKGTDRIAFKLEQCPHCGYCAADITRKTTEAVRECVRSDRYRAQRKDRRYPRPANVYLCRRLILEAEGNPRGTIFAVLGAVYACDDARAYEAATELRKEALAMMIDPAIGGEETRSDQPGGRGLILADLYRRTGQFSQAIEVCDAELARKFVGRDLPLLLRFERRLASLGDTDPHDSLEISDPQKFAEGRYSWINEVGFLAGLAVWGLGLLAVFGIFPAILENFNFIAMLAAMGSLALILYLSAFVGKMIIRSKSEALMQKLPVRPEELTVQPSD